MAGQVNRQTQLEKTGSSVAYNEIVKLRAAQAKEFTIQGLYKYGYRNKEDISNLPASTLVVGSQNVLTNAAEQIAIRNGYQLDGLAGNQNTYGIDSSYDFNTHTNGVRNLRKWGTNLEVRYQNPVTQAISWINIYPTLNASDVVNFCPYWDTSGPIEVCLFVNGDNNVHRWTGGMASYLSSTSSTITISGNTPLSQLNFDISGNLLIDGVPYAYTNAGVSSSTPYTENPTNAKVLMTPGLQYISQLFTTGSSASYISAVTAEVNFTSSSAIPINFTCSIYSDNAGVPGTLLASSTTGTASVGGAGDSPIAFVFDLGVIPSTNYHIVFSTSALNNLVNFYIGASSGVGTHTSPDAVTWNASNGYLYATVTESDIGSTTFSGVTPAPSGITVGDAIIQQPSLGVALTNGVPQPFNINLIECLSNQVYYGSFTNNNIYISKTNNYADCTFSSPRLPGEGANAVLDDPPVGFKPQGQQMYISAGMNGWWLTEFTLSSDLTKQSLQVGPLQTATNQGTQSQGLIGKLKNSIVFVSNETIINAFGPVKDIFGNPNFVNMSDPIKYDIDAYNFTGGQVYYYNYFVYVTLPAMGIERLYNVNKKYWEAPQVVPFSRHYEVGGVLYAHSGLTNESYQCYVPGLYSDNGNPINSVIAFPYVSGEGGAANQLKNFNKHYTEGYIAANTTILLTINYDFGGFSGTYTTTITGTEANIIFNKVTDGSLGQNPLGSEPIGSILNIPNQPPIPKFRIINTFPKVDCYEYQIVLSTDDYDQNYALLRSGPAVSASDNQSVSITV